MKNIFSTKLAAVLTVAGIGLMGVAQSAQADDGWRGRRPPYPAPPPDHFYPNSQEVQVHIGQWVRGNARVDILRALRNYNVDYNARIESIDVRVSSGRGTTQALLVNNGYVESSAHIGSGGYGAVLYPRSDWRVADYRDLRVEVRGEVYLDSLVIRLDGYNNYPPNPYPPGPNPYPPGIIYQDVTCQSYKPLSATCSVNGIIQDVQMIRQLSGDACTYGRSWWFDQTSITVTRGCRAQFRVRVYTR